MEPQQRKTSRGVGQSPTKQGSGRSPEVKKLMRTIISLACTDCKRRNYSTTKNKRTTTGRLEFKKYCRWCRTHTVHRESK